MCKSLVVLSLLVAACSAQYWPASPTFFSAVNSIGLSPWQYVAPVPVVASPVPVSSQYHAQDEWGQFTFGHSTATQARHEVKTVDGTVRGGYSYVDPNSKLINVQYMADANGFRVLGANNLPVAPVNTVVDTKEVMDAKMEFAKKFKEAEEAVGLIKEDKKEEKKAVEVEMNRRKRDLWIPSIVPAAIKTTLKTTEFKPVSDAKTPAATRLAEFKDTEKEIITPLAIHTPTIVTDPLISSRIVWG